MAKKKTKKKTSKKKMTKLPTVDYGELLLNRPTDLTLRELQVAVQVGHGRTCREAGQDIGISNETVRSHLATLRKKTAISRKPQLMLWANLNAPWINEQLEQRST